ncbi:MAG: dimethyl sulfoxide reductase anchor subunit [Coriobacteriales bacterium]|jgi:anaerobic dimethyl sulfoxide reductase subunit C (anchor subunit)/Tat-targeted selenate reductase subunit YnfH|nr:dimethyl sulfoxide reductase anchor subunit [Coriobacteriales bacterium]
MENAITELPLALFTTLVPIGSGAFLALALAFLVHPFSPEQLKRIDRLTLLPLLVMALGFVDSVFHLKDPLHIFYVFTGIGSSPLSNEIAIGVLFFVVALIYWMLAFGGKLSQAVRKGYALILGVFALVFAVSCGMAYMIETIVTWNTIFGPLEIVGIGILGGILFGTVILMQAKVYDDDLNNSYWRTALVIASVGLVLSAGALAAHIAFSATVVGTQVSGAEITAVALPFGALAIVGLVASFACLIGILTKRRTALSITGFGLVLIASFLGRMVFYLLELNVGL